MFVDVRHKRRLLFRYDPQRRLIEIRDRDGDLVIIDLTQYEGRCDAEPHDDGLSTSA